jgi:hypothetical protein
VRTIFASVGCANQMNKLLFVGVQLAENIYKENLDVSIAKPKAIHLGVGQAFARNVEIL